MTDTMTLDDAPPRKRGKGLLLSLGLSVLLGGAAFGTVYFDLLPMGGTGGDSGRGSSSMAPAIAFVPLDPLVISLSGSSTARHLKLTLQLEVAQGNAEAVAFLRPRIADVLNSYLQALQPADIEARAAMIEIRAQMLRRAQIVTGEGMIRDLLITEFVLN